MSSCATACRGERFFAARCVEMLILLSLLGARASFYLLRTYFLTLEPVV
jgi:hypothetical protein